MPSTFLALRSWTSRRWAAAIAAGLVAGLLVALPTAVIPNPVFGREIGVTWWSYPVVIVTAIALLARRVNPDSGAPGRTV